MFGTGRTAPTHAPGVPDSAEGPRTLRDPWGNFLIYMRTQHTQVGMAPEDRPFFFSAGPDRRYLTREDNLYSYEGGTEK